MTTEVANKEEENIKVSVEQANVLHTWITIVSDVAPNTPISISDDNTVLFQVLKQSGYTPTKNSSDKNVINVTAADASLIKVWIDRFNQDMSFQEYMRMIRSNGS